MEKEIGYLKDWADKNKCRLDTDGEIGFGRPCVGITFGDHYVDYGNCADDSTLEYPFYVPEAAYHKGDYLAVLGSGDTAIEELYKWVKSIEEAGFVVETKPRIIPTDEHPIQTMMSGTTVTELVKAPTPNESDKV